MLKIDPLPKIITITGADDRAGANIANPVSYTHLTLPTNREV